MRTYLTKSIFKIGIECPRKLFYHKKPTEYFNGKEEDPFLESLAQGGYQVGALAQLKYPGGIEIKERDYTAAAENTQKYFSDEQAVLFEAAFLKDSFYVRADISIKAGSNLRIIEVKSKSFESDDNDVFLSPQKSKPGAPKLYANWIPYIYDLAFQVYVARLNYPDLTVSASMMLLDKVASASDDGLHQLFLVKKSGSSKEVVLTKDIPTGFKGHQLLKEVDVTEIVDAVIEGRETSDFHIMGDLASRAQKLAEIYLNSVRYPVQTLVAGQCKGCEFRGSHKGLKSGFDECWTEAANIESASSKKMVFDLWNFRGTDKAFENRKYLLEQLDESDLGKKPTKNSARQLLQIEKHREGSQEPWFDLAALKAEIDTWKWPLHFIDFETCAPAIPFKKGFAPYSEVAFQFSHHIMEADGRVSHIGQFIELNPGSFPSFDFVRELKKQLETDNGTVFRYSNHENSVLNRIVFLLQQSEESDRDELIRFIKTLTKKKASDKKDDYLWNGDRCMVDLLEVVKECYLSPLIGGSNSLKYVLPAILAESDFLREKYSKPVYGTSEMPSLNFTDHVWIKELGADGICDPYKELPPLFSAEDLQKIDSLISDEDQIRNGGAAMMAYCRTQFTEMSIEERDAIQKALLKYCELDTLAMVMLVEYWLSVFKDHFNE
ncbi:MAG: DUF2779 domain-containing protein [Bdellovibrio sp.]